MANFLSILFTFLFLLGSAFALGNDVPGETERSKEITLGNEGPWGQLEYYRIPLACPESTMRLLPSPSQQVEWVFDTKDLDVVRERLRSTGFPIADVDQLLNAENRAEGESGMRIFPPAGLVSSLSPTLRGRIYPLLSTDEKNRFFKHPIFFHSPNLSRWFEGSTLPDQVIQEIANLAYPTPSGKGFYLSDIAHLMHMVGSSQSERTLMKALLRKPAIVARLRLGPQRDLDKLADYWTAGYRFKDVVPLMESVQKAPGIEHIEISHLLPPDARSRLNSFPTQIDGVTGRYPDWFWTCYNFYHFYPKNVYADSPERSQILESEFTLTMPPYQFGDLIVFRKNAEPVHGCIHIADDIVYTKNSADLFSPWILMPLEEVAAYHEFTGYQTMQVYRKK